MTRCRVELSRTALEDLGRIAQWIVEAGAPLTARRYVASIQSRIELLAEVPDSGRLEGTKAGPVRVIGFERRVMVAYRVVGDRLEVLRIFSGGQDWRREPGADTEGGADLS